MADSGGGGGNRGGRNNNAGPGLTPVVLGRKRGHQHHVRHSGARRSNVPADEVIAALRGEPFPLDDPSIVATTPDDIVMQSSTGSSSSHSDTNSNRSILAELNANVRTTSDLSNSNANRDLPESTQAMSPSDSNNNTNNNGDEDVSVCSDLSESTTASNSSKKAKTKRRSSRNHESPSTDRRRRRPKAGEHTSTPSPRGERPPLEGAASIDAECADGNGAPSETIDIENDPEAAEWLKLRCTSERTEVVAEREYRRQNRRCADYPGLAFGRSIFSSDTMMKLNIIRNELHNIMKTQLKRVRYGA